jgi:membrane protease YdiL (CAAX protease family)
MLFLQIRRKKIKSEDLFLQKPIAVKLFLFWTIGFLVYIIVTELVLHRLGVLEIDKWKHPLLPSIIRILGAVVLAPIAEELIFRGLLLNLFIKRKFSVHLAIFLQACFFVLLHNFTYENTLTSNIGIVQTLIDASLFGYARYHTKSIYTPISMHITGNFIATLERFV